MKTQRGPLSKRQAGLITAALLISMLVPAMTAAGPAEDLKIYRDFFKKRYPDLTLVDLSNGSYNFNTDKREQWESIMDFPPYEFAVEEGAEMLKRPFKNGKTYADCLPNGGIGIAHTYPRFDAKTGKVVNLTAELNTCRVKNGEKPLHPLKGPLIPVLTYLAETSRGKKINITIPDDPRALAAYEDGKRVYFTRRGPRGFACYHCHWEASGLRIRGNELSTAVGQATHFPTYRSKWGAIGPIQRRYKGCMKNTGAKPLKPQSEHVNNLEYFHTHMSNGIPMNAPGTRF